VGDRVGPVWGAVRPRATPTAAAGYDRGSTVVSDPRAPPLPSAMETLAGDARSAAPAPKKLSRGASVGRYVILDPLGAGGMGIVYAAFDPELDRRVAIKLIQPASDPDRAETARARLLREAQALAKLSHPAVIAVHDAGTFGGQVFVAMELVDGPDLATWLREAPRTFEQIVAAFLEAGRGLAAAHAVGIVHRDFKPENVLVGKDGRVRVLDFGLAHADTDTEATAQRTDSVPASEAEGTTDPLDDPEHGARLTGLGSQLSTRLTQAGAIVGTPAYMSPEQHLGRRTDARTDQFSFCVALYEALYRQRPFPGATPHELMFSVLKGKVREPPRTSTVPGWIRRVLQTGLAVDPEARFPDMATLLAALSPEPRRRARRLAWAGAAGLVTAGALFFAWPSAEPSAPSPCTGAERKLEGVWDDTIRSRIHDAFLATERPYAEDTFATSARFLDAYTARWVELHTDACEATAIRKEQSQEMLDRQMVCLARRLREVEELTRLFVDADEDIVQRAVPAAGRLSALEPCADQELLALAEAPLTGERAERVSEIDSMLAGAQHRLRLARYEPALKMARAALAAAQEIQHPRQAAAALWLRGRAEEALGRYGDAERTLYEALWAADDAGDDRERAEVWSTLVWVVAYRLGRYEDADRLGGHATHALARAGGDDVVLADLHNNLGAAALARDDVARAISEYEATLVLRRRLGPDHPDVAASLGNLALSHMKAGAYEVAERHLQEAQEISEGTFGPSHPRTASLLHTRGLIAYRQARHDEAIERLRRVVLVREAGLPRGHEDTTSAIHDLGEAQLAAGDARAALVQFQRAVEIRRESLAGDHAGLANSLSGVGRARAAVGDAGELPEAIAALDEALAMLERLGHTGPLVAETQLALAEVLVRAPHRPDTARARRLAASAREVYAEAPEGAPARHAAELARIDAVLTGDAP
jgi:tetratricopeptide (TPR) repeat protein/predicted Ser/Thr protein kinase